MRISLPAFASLALPALLSLAAGCSGPKIAPPPTMGDLSGAWLLETEDLPVRFVTPAGDTLSLTVGREPLRLQQGKAVSDTSIVIDIAGLFVSGAMNLSKGRYDRTEAELVTGGAAAGTLAFRAQALSFTGTWNGQEFSGRVGVDLTRAGEDAAVLDPPRGWTLRRLESGGASDPLR